MKGKLFFRPFHMPPADRNLPYKKYIRVCGGGSFEIFPLLQIRSNDIYETKSQRECKTKLNKLCYEPEF